MISALKKRVSLAIEMLPYGRDIFLWLSRSRTSMSYRGCFDSRQEAAQAISESRDGEYDVINKNKAANAVQEEAKLDTYFKDTDYPLFFWLTRALEPETHLLELGGSLGHFYYACKRFEMLPERTSWTVAELPEAVSLGASIGRKRGEQALGFIDSRRIAEVAPTNLFLTSGTLQYMEDSLADILQGLKQMPKHLLVHHLPVHKTKSFWTLQKLSLCEVPYRVYGYQDLMADIQRLGYSLISEWRYPRTIEIPFRRSETSIEGYLGFYFRLDAPVD